MDTLESRWTRREKLIVLGLCTLAWALRIIFLNTAGMWTDEFHTLIPIRMSWWDMANQRLRQGHLPTYFGMIKLWTGVFGISDTSMRLPSALVGGLLPAAVWWALRPFARRPALIGLALLAAVHATDLHSSREARMYSFVAVGCVVAHGFFLRAVLREAGQRAWWGFATSAALAATMQPIALATLPGSFLWLVQRGRPGLKRHAFRALGAILLLCLPLVALLAWRQEDWQGLKTWNHLRKPELGLLPDRFGQLVLGFNSGVPWGSTLTVAVLLPILIFGFWHWRARTASDARDHEDLWIDRRLVAWACSTIALFTCVLIIGATVQVHVLGPARYFIPLMLPAWVLVAVATSELRAPARRMAVVVMGFMAMAHGAKELTDRGTGMREAVQWLVREYQPQDVVLVRASNTIVEGMRHYGFPINGQVIQIDGDADPADLQEITQTIAHCPHIWLLSYREGKRPFFSAITPNLNQSHTPPQLRFQALHGEVYECRQKQPLSTE